MILVFEMLWTGTQHAVGNSATLQAIARGFPEQSVRVFADPTHLAELRRVLRPGAQLAYVVGDQASYLLVMIRTGQILAEIALSLGYEVVGIDLFRTRLATATREQLREEVVLLRWPGKPASPMKQP